MPARDEAFLIASHQGMRNLPDRGGRCFDCYDRVQPLLSLCLDCEAVLRTELEVPDSERIDHAWVPGRAYGPRWRDFRVHLVYSFAPEKRPSPGRRIQMAFLRGDGAFEPFSMNLYRQTVTRRGSPLRLVRSWNPRSDLRVAIEGLDQMARKSQLDDIWQGAALFLDHDKRGRPRGSFKVLDFPRAVREAYAEYRDLGERPRQQDIAEAVGYKISAFKDNLVRFNVEWPPL